MTENLEITNDVETSLESFEDLLANITPEMIEQNHITQEIISNESEIMNTVDNTAPAYIVIKVNFPSTVPTIQNMTQATGEKGNVVAVNDEIRLILGRMYNIPVDNALADSDNFKTIKLYSIIAKLVDIRYIKDGYACVIPLCGNISIKNGQELCILTN